MKITKLTYRGENRHKKAMEMDRVLELITSEQVENLVFTFRERWGAEQTQHFALKRKLPHLLFGGVFRKRWNSL